MSLYRTSRYILTVVFVLSLVVLQASAWESIAHRGVFHDQTEAYCIPENSLDAIIRALTTQGLAGVEIDLRIAQDGTVMCYHDYFSNRGTTVDNAFGLMNAIKVGLKQQPLPAGVKIQDHDGAFWTGKPLKTYGPNARITTPAKTIGMITLNQLMESFKIIHVERTNRIIILDCQDWLSADRAARIVRDHGLTESIYIKFFASKGLSPAAEKFNGANTCYDYARLHGWGGLKIIPQINDGELIYKGGKAYIHAFQTDLDVEAYLACWSVAQAQHGGNGAAFMPMVAASVPSKEIAPAIQASATAMNWAKRNGRKTISVVSLPDACTLISGRAFFWQFNTGGIVPYSFPRGAYELKKAFADKYADYAIVDVMGNFDARTQTSDWKGYTDFLC